MEFQKLLWENVMIRSTSEAQCESIGSLFVIHFCNLNNEKNINLKILKSSLISRLPNGIVQILNRYIQAWCALQPKKPTRLYFEKFILISSPYKTCSADPLT